MPFAPWSISREWDVEAPLSLVWEVVAHTDKLNRAVGLPPVVLGSMDGSELTREVTTRLYGLVPTKWIEYPFEWTREQGYVVRRDFEGGPLLRFHGGVELTPIANGTRVRIHARLTARNVLGRLAIPLIGRHTIRKSWAYFRRSIEQRKKSQAPQSSDQISCEPTSSPSAPTLTGPIDKIILKQRATELEENPSLDQRLVATLVRHLGESGEEDVVRMRPYWLATQWQADRSATLRVFLHATKAGLLNLTWELMCPNCRVPKAEGYTLAEVTSEFHCDTCGVDYAANFDRYVELRFQVNPAIRSVRDQIYCFGGPYSGPHILIQHVLKPGEMREVETMLDHDVYRLRALRVNRSLLLVPESPCAKEGEAAGDALDVQYHSGGWTWSETTFKPGPFRLRWMNSSSQTAGVVLERVQWDPHAVTAAEVTALQEFRDLFGSEVLCPGQEIGIESVTVLFSDLKDSTRLYEITGDAPAYGHVREHFDFLKERIARTRGAVVKTIGDAVMAIFHLPEDAIQCCAEVQRDVGAFNAAWPNRPALTVKLGVHYGPAIAINANGQLDYFGRTVNIAARIARESDGGDMVVTKTLLQDERVGRVLHRHRASVVAEWTSKLRGMQEALVLCRVRIEAYNSDHEPNS